MRLMMDINSSGKTRLVVFQALIIYVFATFMSGCAVKPKTISFEQRKQRVIQDWQTSFNQNDILPRKMTMQMAMARALKYNLDIKIQTFQSVLGQEQLDVSNFAMWPQLLGSLGYFSRSNENASKSLNLDTNTENFSYSTSSDKTHSTQGLQFSWNLLDFGTSYIAAKQNADKFLIEVQRNRKMVQNVMRDVRNAYWQAYTAQEVERDLGPLMAEVRAAISSSSAASTEKLSPELENLNYRRSLYDILRNLTELQKNLVEAKANLSALTVVPPGSTYTLLPTSTSKPPLPKDFPMDLPLLEKVALYDRPELQEADYLKRISLNEIDKVRLQMLPGINLSYGATHDTNKFLLNRVWADAGAQLSWNVLKIFSARSNVSAAKASSAVTDLQRMALSVVVMTQVDVAYYRYQEAVDELNVNSKILSVDTDIEQQMTKMYKEGTTDLLSVIRARANRILAKLRHNLSYAEWQNAGGQLLSSIGYDLAGGIDTSAPIANISDAVHTALNKTPEISPTIKEISHIPGFKSQGREVAHKVAVNLDPISLDAMAIEKARTNPSIVKQTPAKSTKNLPPPTDNNASQQSGNTPNVQAEQPSATQPPATTAQPKAAQPTEQPAQGTPEGQNNNPVQPEQDSQPQYQFDGTDDENKENTLPVVSAPRSKSQVATSKATNITTTDLQNIHKATTEIEQILLKYSQVETKQADTDANKEASRIADSLKGLQTTSAVSSTVADRPTAPVMDIYPTTNPEPTKTPMPSNTGNQEQINRIKQELDALKSPSRAVSKVSKAPETNAAAVKNAYVLLATMNKHESISQEQEQEVDDTKVRKATIAKNVLAKWHAKNSLVP